MQESFASVEFWESLSLPDPFLNFIKESGTVENGFLGIPPHFRDAEKKELKKKKRGIFHEFWFGFVWENNPRI